MLREQKGAAGSLVLAGMDLLTVGKVAGDVITNEVALGDAGKVLAGTLDQLHGINNYVMGNAEGAAQIEAHANGESADLTATQAATNGLTQSVAGDSTRLVSSGTIAGAHDSLTGTNYINAGLTDSYISTVGHEMAHSYTRSESIAEYMGWATDVIWSSGVWANSAAISAYKPAAINLASLHEQNSRLLQDNNANLTTSLLSHGESFNYSLLGDDARALLQVGVNWAASKVDKPWAKGMVKGVGGLVDGGMAVADAVLDTAGSAMHCPFGNADACKAAMDANRKRGEAGIQFGKYIVSGKAGADLADTIWNLNHGTPEQVAEAQEAIVKFSTELGLGAVVAKVGVASKGGAATTTSTKAAAPAIAKSEAASPKPTTLPADGGKAASTLKASDGIGQAVDQGTSPAPDVASDFTALLDDYPYQPGWTSFEDLMAQADNVHNESLLPDFHVAPTKESLSYDISSWGEYGLPSDGYFVRSLTREQYVAMKNGFDVDFGGMQIGAYSPLDENLKSLGYVDPGYPNGMGFMGSAEQLRSVKTRSEYMAATQLDYAPRYLIEFQLRDPAGLNNALQAPYALFEKGGLTRGTNFSEFNYQNLNSEEVVNPIFRELGD